MKKQLFITGILLAALSIAKAQNPDTAQLLIHYKFTYVADTTNREHPHTENMVLFVGRHAGAYKSYDAMLEQISLKNQIAAQMAASPDGRITINERHTGSSVEYYQFPDEKKIFTKDNGPLLHSSGYLMEDPMPVIDWKISSDTATFGGFNCQKATTRFKGRDYTAWFCPDLPVRVGPWKLNGLPGVIIDARDAKNEVIFRFDGVERPISSSPAGSVRPDNQQHLAMLGFGIDDADPNLIAIPAKAIKTTQREFNKLKEAARNNPSAFAQTMMGDGPKGAPPGREPVTNNPIELPDKN